ncbi:hypothetical protein LJB95_00850, partial [Paludibacteraceae bacterium OttesenSCG-928-F17]|nr:hypothetical protein [Paludibacteraceae bacterium OttesenSCG-928-F17]
PRKPKKADNDNDNDIYKEILSNESIKKETNVSSLAPSEIEFEKFCEWLKEATPYCANPKNFTTQITIDDFRKLREKYTVEQICVIVEQIENRKDLRKRYTHLYRTVLNWAKKEYGDAPTIPQGQKIGTGLKFINNPNKQ